MTGICTRRRSRFGQRLSFLRGLFVATCLVALPSAPGCTTRVALLSLAAPDRSEDWPLVILQPNVEGRACDSRLLRSIPIGDTRPTLEAAVEEAVGRVPDAQLLTNVTVDLETIDFVVFSRSCTRVLGTAARRAPVIHIH